MKKLKNTKRCGERSEAAFLHKASELGFGIAKPWGDSERYDFILDNGSRLLRVQIKATDCLRAHAYETRATYTVGKGRAVYGPKDIDFLIARHPARPLVRAARQRLHARAHAPLLSPSQS